jgi:hypothetical protein
LKSPAIHQHTKYWSTSRQDLEVISIINTQYLFNILKTHITSGSASYAMPGYGKAEYWDDRYAADESPFDWLFGFEVKTHNYALEFY